KLIALRTVWSSCLRMAARPARSDCSRTSTQILSRDLRNLFKSTSILILSLQNLLRLFGRSLVFTFNLINHDSVAAGHKRESEPDAVGVLDCPRKVYTVRQRTSCCGAPLSEVVSETVPARLYSLVPLATWFLKFSTGAFPTNRAKRFFLLEAGD